MTDAPPASEVELLELGRTGGHSRRSWLRAALVALTLVVLLVAAALAYGRLASSDPTLTRAEVAAVYASPLAAGPGTLEWDPSTRLVEDGGQDVTSSAVEPAECEGIVDADAPPVSVDLVSASFIPLSRPDGGQIYSGTVVTYRYLGPAQARARYAELHDLLGRCSALSDNGTPVTVDQVAASDVDRGRSDLSFRLDGVGVPVRITVTRFGNTVTWITTAAVVDPAASHEGNVPDLLVARMQTRYRQR